MPNTVTLVVEESLLLRVVDERTRGQRIVHHKVERRFWGRSRCSCGVRWGRCPDATEAESAVRTQVAAALAGRYWSNMGDTTGELACRTRV